MSFFKIYILDISNINNIEDYLYLIPEFRKDKLNRINNNKAKIEHVLSSALLKYVFGLNRIDIDRHKVSYNDNGKPYIKDLDNLYFNISHSHKYIMCCLSDAEVGCDVEKITISDKCLKIANRFYTEEENEAINNEIVLEDKCSRFYRLWTLKESYIKAIGKGVSYGLDSFSILFDENDKPLPIGRYSFLELNNEIFYNKFNNICKLDYIFSVCFLGNINENDISINIIDLNDLKKNN